MDLDHIFKELQTMLQKHSSNLDSYDEFINSTAKEKKDAYHLYGKHKVEINGRKNKVFLAGIIKQKKYVGFYFIPIYSDPDKFPLDTKLEKCQQGKSCFHIKNTDIIPKIEDLLIQGKKLYQEKGWV
jgi:hypothetical protein